jgi:hypothetical protein
MAGDGCVSLKGSHQGIFGRANLIHPFYVSMKEGLLFRFILQNRLPLQVIIEPIGYRTLYLQKHHNFLNTVVLSP